MSLSEFSKITDENRKNIVAFSKPKKPLKGKAKGKIKVIARYRKYDFDNPGFKDEESASETGSDSDGETKEPEEIKEGEKVESIIDPDRDFYLYPRSSIEDNNKYRDVVLIIGASGSGKTYQAMVYIKNYISIYPENRVFIFTPVPEDESLNAIRDYETVSMVDARLPVNKDDFDISRYPNSLWIFDDITAVEKDNQLQIDTIRNQILETGRHYAQSILITEHSFKGEKRILKPMAESNRYIIFPGSGDTERLLKFMVEKIGLGTKQSREILRIKSNHVIIVKDAPLAVIYQNGIDIIKNPLDK